MNYKRRDLRPDRLSVSERGGTSPTPASDLAIGAVDADGRIVDWRADAESLTGWSADEVVGDQFTVLYASGYPNVDIGTALARARDDGLFEDEGWLRRADGTEFWASISVSTRQAGGEPSRFRLVLQDRSERKRLEDERALLAEVGRTVASAESFVEGAEAALSAVCEHTNWAYGEAWVPTDGDRLEQLVAHAENEELASFADVSRSVTFPFGEGLPGRVWASESREWIPDASAEQPDVFHRTEFAQAVGLQAALGVPITTEDGVVAVLTFALRERRPADEGLVDVVSDVAADLGGLMVRKRIADDLEHERSLLERIFETSPVGLLVTDTDRTVVRANGRAADVFGVPASDLSGRRFERLADAYRDTDGNALPGQALPVDEVLETGEATDVECQVDRCDGDSVWAAVRAAPITASDGDVERVIVTIEDITARKDRERTLRRQRNSLERVKRTIESLRPINREILRAGTRDDIEQVVCEQLATSDAYLFAWIGDYNAATGEIRPRHRAGTDEEFVRDLDLSLFDDGSDGRLERAVSERTVQAHRGITMESSTHRDRALDYGYHSRAVVPVVYGETVHGVIGVYSARPDAFDEYERGLLAELGERVGHAINAAEHKQLLHTDTVVELEFDVGEDSPLVAVADRLDCRLSLTDLTPTSNTAYVCYVEVDGADPERVVQTLTEQAAVDRARVVTARGETGSVEVTGELGPVATLAEHGATARTFEVTPGGGTLIAETAPQSDIESLVTAIEGASGDTVFVAKRTLDRESRTPELSKTAVEDRLTDRQREALTLAYHAGYFASPRHSTGEELADALGISSPTFYRHVRKATEKVVALLVEADDTSARILSTR